MNHLAQLGEDRVAFLLEEAHWQIEARNFRIKGAELDIVARKGNTLAVVEVKTRRANLGSKFAYDELVCHRKLTALRRGARAAQQRWNAENLTIRLDIAFVIVGRDGPQLKHYWVDALPLNPVP